MPDREIELQPEKSAFQDVEEVPDKVHIEEHPADRTEYLDLCSVFVPEREKKLTVSIVVHHALTFPAQSRSHSHPPTHCHLSPFLYRQKQCRECETVSSYLECRLTLKALAWRMTSVCRLPIGTLESACCVSGPADTRLRIVITFAICGPFCNALVKLFGPKIVLSATFMGVSLVVIGTGLSSNRASFFALRLREFTPWGHRCSLQCSVSSRRASGHLESLF